MCVKYFVKLRGGWQRCPRLCLFSVTPVDISYVLDSTCMCLSKTRTSRIKVSDGLSEATKANTIIQLKERYPDLCAVLYYSVCSRTDVNRSGVPYCFQDTIFWSLGVSAFFCHHAGRLNMANTAVFRPEDGVLIQQLMLASSIKKLHS